MKQQDRTFALPRTPMSPPVFPVTTPVRAAEPTTRPSPIAQAPMPVNAMSITAKRPLHAPPPPLPPPTRAPMILPAAILAPTNSALIAMSATLPEQRASSDGPFARRAGPALLGFVVAAAVYILADGAGVGSMMTEETLKPREARTVAPDRQGMESEPPRPHASRSDAPKHKPRKLRSHGPKRTNA